MAVRLMKLFHKKMSSLLCLLVFVGCVKYGLADDCTGKNLLLVSMDGFAWDYLEKVETPNFDKLSTLGVKAKHMKGTFSTKTFPSHYSIATGIE